MHERLIIERQCRASADAVYNYLVTSTNWIEWQGSAAELDPRPGGIFKMSMPDGRIARGQYIELKPFSKVVFSWGWVDMPGLPPGSTTVTVDLLSNDDGTLIRLTHEGLGPDEAAMHAMGWNHYLPRLALAAEGQSPGEDLGPQAP